jgi:uracil phosphoribosyltransferase
LVSSLRDQNRTPHAVQEIIANITTFLLYEALQNAPLMQKNITTWQGEGSFEAFEENDFVFVPILRAGMPMLNKITTLLPNSVSGFLAMKRDEKTLQPHILYDRIPNVAQKSVFLLDPMVATGGSLQDAIDFIQTKNPKKIVCLNIIAYEKTLLRLAKSNPDIDFFIAQIDTKLNENGFIIPGIGDAGDRAYNTL